MLFKRRKHGLPGFFFKGEVAVQQLFALRGQGAARPFGAAFLGGKIYLQINGDCVYSESDLLRTIKGIADVTQPEHIREYINKQFLNYDSSEFFKPLVPVLQDMKLFQKLTLHQLSHDQLQTPTFSTKEIECCFYLLEKLEKVVLGLRKMNSGGNIYRV